MEEKRKKKHREREKKGERERRRKVEGERKEGNGVTSNLNLNLKVAGSMPGSTLREIIHPKTTSYFGIMGDRFDLKLIPEFNGSTPVLDWVEKVELHCLLSGVKSIEHVIPLRPSDGAFAVYQQLSAEEKQSYERIKAARYKAFAIDPATAWEQFEARALHAAETVDVYLAELTKLTVLFGELPERALAYKFLAGLPTKAKQLLHRLGLP